MPCLILCGDISQIKADIIVNSADTSLLGGGAVAQCLHKAAGRGLKRACAALKGCAVGDVKVTKGCKLPCKYVIHAVAPVWQGGQNGEEALLASCYRRALKQADDLGCSSVAFPLLAAGANGYPKEEALRVASDTIAEFLEERELDVLLVFLERDAFPKDIIPDYRELHYSRTKCKLDSMWYFQNLADEYYYHHEGCIGCLDGPASWIYDDAFVYYYVHEEAEDFAKKRLDEADRCDRLSDILKKLPALLHHAVSLEDLSGDPQENWKQMLLRFMRSKGFSCKECARRANIRSDYLQKLCSEEDVVPSKHIALALAVALELSVAETREMLAKLGFTWQRCDRFEDITDFFIAKGIYDVHSVNLALFAYGQRLLGACALSFFECNQHDKRKDYFDELIAESGFERVYSDNTKNENIRYSDDGKILLKAGEGCSSVTIPSGVASIEEYAFKDCRNLSAVYIPASVKTIERGAFQNCISLTSVTLPAHLESVSPYLFGSCRRLTKAELPDDVSEICAGAFFNCDRLSFVKLPLNLKSIGHYAFWNCRKLEMLDIPAGVEIIEWGAFYNCQSLRGIALPAGLKAIHNRAFMNCSSITSVMLPARCNYIGDRAFSECISLVTVDIADVEAVNVPADSQGSSELASLDTQVLERLSSHAIEELLRHDISYWNINYRIILDKNVHDKVAAYAFWKCTHLVSVSLPSCIAIIEKFAFAYCESLRDISIPDSVTEIGDGAFIGCTSLEELVIPDSVSKIAADAFEGVPCVVYNGTAEGAPWGARKVVPRRVGL